MLKRLKKNQEAGFKHFVQSLETTPLSQRFNIVHQALLEDPLYMEWVSRNLKSSNDLIDITMESWQELAKQIPEVSFQLARVLKGLLTEKRKHILENLPAFLLRRCQDDLSTLQNITAQEEESALFFVLKNLRLLQSEAKIEGFKWHLPPVIVYLEIAAQIKIHTGKCELFYSTGVLAARGEFLDGKRLGFWQHFYEKGMLFASGQYANDLKVGEWIFYYPNQKIRLKGSYRQDEKHGDWISYSKNQEMHLENWVEGKRQDISE
jgi:hypothetical protein